MFSCWCGTVMGDMDNPKYAANCTPFGETPVLKLVGFPKLPAPSPNRTETLLEFWFVMARSILPSLLKSPTATLVGFTPTLSMVADPKFGVGQSACARLPRPRGKTMMPIARRARYLPSRRRLMSVKLLMPRTLLFVIILMFSSLLLT